MGFYAAVDRYLEHYPVRHQLALDHFAQARVHGDETISVELVFEGVDVAGGTKGALYTKEGLLADSFGDQISKGLLTSRAQSTMTVFNAKHGEQTYSPLGACRLVADLYFQWDPERKDGLSRELIAKTMMGIVTAPPGTLYWTQDALLEIVHRAHRELVDPNYQTFPVSVVLIGFERERSTIPKPIPR